jgi:hypothetical protein
LSDPSFISSNTFRVLSLAFTCQSPSLDLRSRIERRRVPRVLDVGWTEMDRGTLEGREGKTEHVWVGEEEFTGHVLPRLPYFRPSSSSSDLDGHDPGEEAPEHPRETEREMLSVTLTKQHLGDRFETFLNLEAGGPIILLCHDEELTRRGVAEWGVSEASNASSANQAHEANPGEGNEKEGEGQGEWAKRVKGWRSGVDELLKCAESASASASGARRGGYGYGYGDGYDRYHDRDRDRDGWDRYHDRDGRDVNNWRKRSQSPEPQYRPHRRRSRSRSPRRSSYNSNPRDPRRRSRSRDDAQHRNSNEAKRNANGNGNENANADSNAKVYLVDVLQLSNALLKTASKDEISIRNTAVSLDLISPPGVSNSGDPNPEEEEEEGYNAAIDAGTLIEIWNSLAGGQAIDEQGETREEGRKRELEEQQPQVQGRAGRANGAGNNHAWAEEPDSSEDDETD